MARSYGNSDGNGNLFIGGIVILLAIVLIGFNIVNNLHTESYSDCVVTEKDRTTNRDGESDMRVYTENCGVFRVADSVFMMRWNSSDVYSSIKEGKTYDFTTRGYRIGLMSKFPNIDTATEVKK